MRQQSLRPLWSGGIIQASASSTSTDPCPAHLTPRSVWTHAPLSPHNTETNETPPCHLARRNLQFRRPSPPIYNLPSPAIPLQPQIINTRHRSPHRGHTNRFPLSKHNTAVAVVEPWRSAERKSMKPSNTLYRGLPPDIRAMSFGG